jgi:thiamine kinase-like enzyme
VVKKQAIRKGYLGGIFGNRTERSERLNFLQKQNILNKKKLSNLLLLFEKISKWKPTPCLNHCDLRLKNVIVNDAGEIQIIIDWENCASNIAPYGAFLYHYMTSLLMANKNFWKVMD